MKKRKQHYVWREYLRAWSSKEKIFCLRNGEIFRSNLMGVAVEKDFYKLKELNETDIEFVKMLVIEQSEPFLREVHLKASEAFNLVFKLRASLEKQGEINPETNQKLDELINNFEEDFHSSVEIGAIKYLASILNKNLDFYTVEKDRLAFLCYLCFQYFRTNKIKSNMLSNVSTSGIPEQFCIRFEKTYNIFSHIFAYNVAYSIVTEPSYEILLVLNDSNIPLITGDQPVVNTFASSIFSKTLVNDLEFYYPVSPFIAILITSKGEYAKVRNLHLTEADEAHQYNSLIVQASHQQIYSNSQELLESYRRQG